MIIKEHKYYQNSELYFKNINTILGHPKCFKIMVKEHKYYMKINRKVMMLIMIQALLGHQSFVQNTLTTKEG